MSGVKADAKAIFLEALDCQGADELMRYLEQACGSDAALRTRVDELMRAHRDAGAFLGGAEKQGATCDHPSAQHPGTVIGRYKLLQQIGEGGMGTVYMAEQSDPVERKVALKVIKPGMDSRQVIARFEAERQALAMMDHVNIARVLDAGATESGLPYFVMELVHGVPITAYCDDNHLTPRERLELFVPVCQAIQHAHQKGIIHRDIKPSNVMITLYDGKPVPKVIDFGVAKATEQRLTERTLFTQYGTLVGTLEYMSPEQAEMSALGTDTRSDIYSLGVLLYELLTGSTPLTRKRIRGAAFGEILRLIKEEEPPKPSTRLSDSGEALASISAQRHTEPAKLTKLIRGELDWIVMKTLEKDRNRRYETANGFAMDVQRYLADEAVQACPSSALYRMRKFARRNKAALLTAGVVAAALLVATLVSTWQAIRATRAETLAQDRLIEVAHERDEKEKAAVKALAAAAAEKQAKDSAEANFQLAKESVVKYLGAVTDDPELEQADSYHLRKKLLESSLPFFQKIAAQKSNDPRLEDNRGQAYYRLATVKMAMGEHEAAVKDAEAMAAIFARLATDFPATQEYRRELSTSQNYLGILLIDLGKRREAEAAYRQALGILEKLAVDFPAVPEYRRDLAGSLNNLGSLLNHQGQRREAEAAYRRAMAVEEKLVADFPTEPFYRKGLASIHSGLGLLLADVGRHAEAEASFRVALGIREKLAADFPTVPEYRQVLAQNYDSLATLLAHIGQHPEAETAYRQALAILVKLAAGFPTVPVYRQDLARTHGRFGSLLQRLGKAPEAEAAFRQALAIQDKLANGFPTIPEYRRGMASDLNNLGGLLAHQEKSAEAETAFRRALAIYKKVAADFPTVPEYREELAASHSNLGIVLSDLGKRGEAETAYRQAMAVEEKLTADFPSVPAYAVGLGGSYCNFGSLIRESGQPEAALGWYQKAIARLEPVMAKEPLLVDAREFLSNSHIGRAEALDALGRHAEAARDWERILDLNDGSRKESIRLRLVKSRLRNSQKEKDAAGCLARAAEYEALKSNDAGRPYDAACYRAVCAAVIPEDPKTPAADAARLAKGQADLAMAWLQKAVALGYKDAEHMKTDSDLDSVRERADFKKLLAGLEAGKSKDKK